MKNQTAFVFFLIVLLTSCIKDQESGSPTPIRLLPEATKTDFVVPTSENAALLSPTLIPVGDVYLPMIVKLMGETAVYTPTPELIPPTSAPSFPIYNSIPLNREEIGVQIHLQGEDLGWLMEHLRALNVGWVKVQVSWKLYQSAPDQYTTDRFANLDAFVTAANENNIAVMLSVSKAPEWSRPTTEMDGPPSDFALFGEFTRHLATRYQGRVAAYELWNEPNLQREWNGFPLSAADLVELIRIGANGVRAVDAEAFIISAAPATTGINDRQTAIDDRVFLREMLAAGVANAVDAIGVHPYGWANAPDSSMSDPGFAPSHNNHPSFFFSDTLHDYAAILAEYGAADKPLWVTEFGWGSFEKFGTSPPAGAEFMTNNSEWQQAEYILRAYELAHGWEFVGPMILWNLNFAPTLGNQFSESGYSLLRPDGSLRPAYRSLQSIQK